MIFGGLDLASRVDNTALVVLKLENGVLEQIGMKVWPHVSYDVIADDLLKIQAKENCTKIVPNRTKIVPYLRKSYLINLSDKNVVWPESCR